MFPAGAAGVALLLLRLCVAGTVLPAAPSLASLVPLAVSRLMTAATALALSSGALTPLSCSFAVAIQIGVLTRSPSAPVTDLIIHGCMALSLLMLGPGAYSVDARLFGRRLVLPDTDEL